MGVYIKGMEMPTTCGKCQIKNAIECNRWKLVRSVALDRHRDCPLVPVPPHGRLIEEADAIETAWMILEGLGYRKEENKQLEQTVREVFATAPAIEVE